MAIEEEKKANDEGSKDEKEEDDGEFIKLTVCHHMMHKVILQDQLRFEFLEQHGSFWYK